MTDPKAIRPPPPVPEPKADRFSPFSDRPARVAADAHHRDRELLAVTATPVPPDTVVLSARGEVDLSTGQLLQDRLLTHLHGTTRRVIVDLSGVGFFGASGLAVLVTANDAAAAAGIGLCVVARTQAVLRPLMITGLRSMFDVSPDLVEALHG